MKKAIGILVLGLLWCSTSFPGPGTGEINLSDKVIKNFQKYISTTWSKAKKKPVKFLVTEDGKDSIGWFCPYTQCQTTGSASEEIKCERQFGKKCYTLAIRRAIKWKNEFTKKAKGKEKRFTSKDDFTTIKSKLKTLGLVNDGVVQKKIEKKKAEKKKKKITKKTTSSSDLTTQLKELKQLLDDGILTEEEFTKAKKKLLD